MKQLFCFVLLTIVAFEEPFRSRCRINGYARQNKYNLILVTQQRVCNFFIMSRPRRLGVYPLPLSSFRLRNLAINNRRPYLTPRVTFSRHVYRRWMGSKEHLCPQSLQIRSQGGFTLWHLPQIHHNIRVRVDTEGMSSKQCVGYKRLKWLR
jgi:hypothetical protein